MQSVIRAIGISTPPYRQNQQAAADIVANALQLKPAEKRLLKSIYRSTGIDYRHSVVSDFCKQIGEYEFFPNDLSLPFPSTAARMDVYKKTALPLAFAAIQNCLASLPEIDKNKISHLITVSCTGMYAPGIDIELVQQLGLNSSVKRTTVNFMGCYGAFNAIKLADAICKADPSAKVLICTVELCTLHFQQNDSMDNMIANAIFADGAAAALIEAESGQKRKLKLEAFHCDLLPQHSKEMTWHIADSGFDIVLSSYVPEAIESGIAQFTERLFQQHGATFADISLYAIHPGGAKILEACEAALGISKNDNRYSYEVLRNYGNMSSATVLFVLKTLWDDRADQCSQEKIFSCAFGPGLTLEAMLLQMG